LALEETKAPVQSLENFEMKKTLVALAALAATSAFAQSSVTISGNVDLGLANVENTATTAAGVTTTRKQSGPNGNSASGWTSNFLGIDSKEDLGNGTTAGFSAAMNLNSFQTAADATQDHTLGSQRHSYVFLGNQLGELRIGYQYTLEDQIQGGVGRNTPTGNTGGRIQNFALTTTPQTTRGATPLAAAVDAPAVTSGATVRANAIEFSTRVNNGFQALAQYGKVRDTFEHTGQANGIGDTDLAAVAAKYSSGPLNLGVAYVSLNTNANVVNTDANTKVKNTHWNYAANYDFGVAKLYGNYATRKADTTGTAAGVNLDQVKRSGYDLGVAVPMGKTTLFANVGKGKYKNFDQAAAQGTNYSLTASQLGATYDFSKRTSLNAYYSINKATGEELAEGVSLKRTMVGFGLRHQF
jgi:predicted porin